MTEFDEHDHEGFDAPRNNAEPTPADDSPSPVAADDSTTGPPVNPMFSNAGGMEGIESIWKPHHLDPRGPLDHPRGPLDDRRNHDEKDRDEDLPAAGLADRALELEARALENSDPLTACLGVLTAQQIRLADQLFVSFTSVAGSTPADIASLERLSKPLAALQALLRQVDRYTQTQIRLSESRAKSKRNDPLRRYRI